MKLNTVLKTVGVIHWRSDLTRQPDLHAVVAQMQPVFLPLERACCDL